MFENYINKKEFFYESLEDVRSKLFKESNNFFLVSGFSNTIKRKNLILINDEN